MGMAAADDDKACELTQALTARLVAHETACCYNPGVSPSINSTSIGQIGEDGILSPSHFLDFTSTISNVAPDSPRCKSRYQQISCPAHQGPFSFHLRPFLSHTLRCTGLVGYYLDVPASRL